MKTLAMADEDRRNVGEMLARTQLFGSLGAAQIAPLVAAATFLQLEPGEPTEP